MRVAFNTSRRDGQHSVDVVKALAWLSQNTRPVSDLAKPDVLRSLLADIERKLDGKRAAPDTIRLRRITLGSALDFAVEKELLDANPAKEVTTKKRKNVLHQVDRRSVANPVQARTVLKAVPGIGRTGRKLVAFFGAMYFAALRPEEASVLRRSHLVMPPREWDHEAGRWWVTQWGDIHLSTAAPEIGAEWTDSGQRSEERGLKHREDGEGARCRCRRSSRCCSTTTSTRSARRLTGAAVRRRARRPDRQLDLRPGVGTGTRDSVHARRVGVTAREASV